MSKFDGIIKSAKEKAQSLTDKIQNSGANSKEKDTKNKNHKNQMAKNQTGRKKVSAASRHAENKSHSVSGTAHHTGSTVRHTGTSSHSVSDKANHTSTTVRHTGSNHAETRRTTHTVSSKHRQKDAAVRKTNAANQKMHEMKAVSVKHNDIKSKAAKHTETKHAAVKPSTVKSSSAKSSAAKRAAIKRTEIKRIDTKRKAKKRMAPNLTALKRIAENRQVKGALQVVKHDFCSDGFKKFTHVFAFPLVFVYLELMLRICSGTSLFAHLIYPVLFGIGTGFFVSFITVLFPRNVNRIISMVILFGTGLIFTAECLVKRSFQWYMPISGIIGGAGGVAGDYLGEAIKAIVAGIPAIVLFFMPAVLYVIYGKQYVPAKRLKPVKALRFLGYSAVVMLAAILLANVGSSAAKYKKQYKFDTATEYFGLMTSLRLETKYSLLGKGSSNDFVIEKPVEKETVAETKEEVAVEYGYNEMDIDFSKVKSKDSAIQDLNAYVQSLTPSKQNAYTGLFEGKNLILICAEAFSDAVISKELTPTLYRMTHNGFYFSEFYQPTWGGSTSTGEYSFLMGIAPTTSSAMQDSAENNLYFTMGNQLQRLGYTSYAYHSGTYDFYSRELTHENLGYDKYLGMGNGIEDIVDWEVDDVTLFDKTLDVYMDKQPFSIYYMTLSGHCIYQSESPYTYKYLEQVESVIGDQYDDTTLYYFCYQMDLEAALTKMIEKLEAAGIADDTVICMTSDHYPYGLEDTATFGNDKNYVEDLYGYEVETSWEQDRNSWIIWSGCLENEHKDMACEISEPTYSLDILPTLSNLFGVEFDSRLMVGRDVFSNAEPIVLWNSYDWVTERGRYSSSNGEFYPNEGYEEDEDYIDRINNIVYNKITFSSSVIANDYYGALFGKDPETGTKKPAKTEVKETGTDDTESADKETETEMESETETMETETETETE